MNRLAFLVGYMSKRSEDEEKEPILPKNPEEAGIMAQISKDSKKVEKKEIKKDLKEMETQLAVLRALKKKKEMALYT